jgi:hypothetical protein
MVFNATFKQYLGYFVVVSSIGGGNRSTRGKPPICRKLLTNLNKKIQTHLLFTLNTLSVYKHDWYPINRFKSATVVYLSHASILISNVICCVCFSGDKH